MTNLPTLRQIAEDPKVLTDLPLEAIEALLSTADAETKIIGIAKRAISGAVESRYADRIAAAYSSQAKDFGTVRVADGKFEIIADTPKKTEWDQALLAAAGDRIAAAGDDPHEYLDVSYSGPERKFTAWPEHIRAVFEPARTVKPGSRTIKLVRRADQREAA